jgi:hypothetical protein
MNNIQSPATGDDAIEREIKDKGLTAPRVTSGDIEANITSEHYFTASEGVVGNYAVRLAQDGTGTYPEMPKPPMQLSLLTFCVLVLKNGFTVTGESACASPENFDAEIGRKIARGNAVQKIWPLMGYELRTILHDEDIASPKAATIRSDTLLVGAEVRWPHNPGDTITISVKNRFPDIKVVGEESGLTD